MYLHSFSTTGSVVFTGASWNGMQSVVSSDEKQIERNMPGGFSDCFKTFFPDQECAIPCSLDSINSILYFTSDPKLIKGLGLQNPALRMSRQPRNILARAVWRYCPHALQP
ncbi:hypothetical protein CDAR_612761 [Caerostris darwini]|uniref:Uncharacterized protein n=1 Tax=Caerostris darwini TaxID=1538125 RepID=A0AAV4WKP2_9ARAC|nr:hypothetical protein CDAR_612761 [Caerostris darwini]